MSSRIGDLVPQCAGGYVEEVTSVRGCIQNYTHYNINDATMDTPDSSLLVIQPATCV